MTNRNQQFEACRKAIDAFVSQAIKQRSQIIAQERAMRDVIDELAVKAVTPEQKATAERLIKLTAYRFELASIKVQLKLEKALSATEDMAASFTGPSGRYLRRHIRRMEDQIEAVNADCARVKATLAAAA